MVALVLRRLVALVAVLIGLAAIVFVLQTTIPADPARAIVGASASDAVVAAKRAQLGYDRPLPAQFEAFMGRLAAGDLQSSLRTRNPVSEDLATFAPATIELALSAALIAAVIGLGLGLLLAGGGRPARIARIALIGSASLPTFLVGLLGIVVFYSILHVLPASGRIDDTLAIPAGPTGLYVPDALLHGDPVMLLSALAHLAMPAFALALLPALAIARTLHASLQQVLREDYVRTARSKGLRERTVIVRHALRNASGPALTMGGLQFGLLLGGVVVIERIFAWPGLGLYLSQSIAFSDLPAITGTTLILGAAYVVVNFLVDLAQAWADPRIRTV
ncbi:MAG: peptide/nickel transport system permease protein [Solirubrobacteraceae bacterium]|jgi:peptide/nickel transport system permease protein|nr:peptide/nickel transport system permease protein [Solirubrobacteraceae bacterium]